MGQEGGSATGGQTYEFQHPKLKGKTPAEVEQQFRAYEAAVKEQGRALNARSRGDGSEGVTPTGRPSVAQGGQPASPPSDADFWKNPTSVMKTMMEEMIRPFQEDLQQGRAMTARQQLAQEFSDFNQLEELIDAMMERSNTPKTPENLRAAYYMAKGMMASQGNGQPAAEPATPQTPEAPPQHRPSSTPMAPSGREQPRKRALTESEKAIARASNMTDEQYLAWLDLEIEDVVDSNIGRPEVK